MSLIRWVELPHLGDERGSLVSLEGERIIPFDIKRVYYIYGTNEDTSRGFHAHKSLQQLAVCVSGKCQMVLDDGNQRESAWLDSPQKAILIGDLIWREMHEFSADCVLLVLASEYYDESDYIRDYQEFLQQVSR